MGCTLFGQKISVLEAFLVLKEKSVVEGGMTVFTARPMLLEASVRWPVTGKG